MLIKSSTYVISSPEVGMCPKADRPEYAFIGRSNVGKSSLINMLANNQKLAKTSSAPGKTQLINHFAMESSEKKRTAMKWYLVDLPGYGFAKVSIKQRKKWEVMIENYLKQRRNLLNVFLLIDARHEPQKLDLEFVNRLGDWEVPFSLVFTKADKETQLAVSRHVKQFLTLMKAEWEFLPPHYVTSAVKRLGRDDILDAIEEMNAQWQDGENARIS